MTEQQQRRALDLLGQVFDVRCGHARREGVCCAQHCDVAELSNEVEQFLVELETAEVLARVAR